MNDRICLRCHVPLKGRADQKFCSDQCRSYYNNQRSVETNNMIRKINRILKKNYFILAGFTTEGKTIVQKSEMMISGFRFDYFTSFFKLRNRKTNFFIYDQGYREYENNKVILVQLDLNHEVTDRLY